jgi:hypothetical protein
MNTIYYFFEDTASGEDGTVEDGAKYYKCYLGKQKVFKVGKS